MNKLPNHKGIKTLFKDNKSYKQYRMGIPSTWTADERYEKWVKEYNKTGIPPYDLWSLDDTMIILLAERVVAFTPFLEQYLSSSVKSQKEDIKNHKKMLKLLAEYFNSNDPDDTISQEIWKLWANIQHRYWY